MNSSHHRSRLHGSARVSLPAAITPSAGIYRMCYKPTPTGLWTHVTSKTLSIVHVSTFYPLSGVATTITNITVSTPSGAVTPVLDGDRVLLTRTACSLADSAISRACSTSLRQRPAEPVSPGATLQYAPPIHQNPRRFSGAAAGCCHSHGPPASLPGKHAASRHLKCRNAHNWRHDAVMLKYTLYFASGRQAVMHLT